MGHVERMPDEGVVKSIYKWKPHATRPKGRPRLRWDGVVKSIYKWKPHATRPKGRPRLRWDDDMRGDLRKMGVNNFKQKAQERKPWRGIIEQAKTHKDL